MRKPNSFLIAIPAFVLGGVLTSALTTTARADPAQSGAKWEYKVVVGGGDLDRWGAEGWEYCGESAAEAYGGGVDRKYTLKRRK